MELLFLLGAGYALYKFIKSEVKPEIHGHYDKDSDDASLEEESYDDNDSVTENEYGEIEDDL